MATEKQQAVLDFIRQHQQETGVPPSVRDIQRQFGFKSPNAAFTHLRALAKKGLVEQLNGVSWGLRAREVQTHLFSLPVYGTIPAGLPAMQEQTPVETIGIDLPLFGVKRAKPHQIWALRVQGDSMIDAHILDGDVVVLERREPHPGDIIAALVDETSTTLKRLVHVRGKPVLRPENKRYEDIVPEHHLASQGVVIGVIRQNLS